jgi:hypothetical protein
VETVRGLRCIVAWSLAATAAFFGIAWLLPSVRGVFESSLYLPSLAVTILLSSNVHDPNSTVAIAAVVTQTFLMICVIAAASAHIWHLLRVAKVT